MTSPPDPIVAQHVVSLEQIPCPACSATDRWDRMDTFQREANNPELVVWCDCGRGELHICIE